MKTTYSELLKKRKAEIALMKEAFLKQFFEVGRRVISELRPDYDNRVQLLNGLNAVYETITEAERDIEYLEAEAKKETAKEGKIKP